jgi:hypothetical protein
VGVEFGDDDAEEVYILVAKKRYLLPHLSKSILSNFFPQLRRQPFNHVYLLLQTVRSQM